VNHTIHHSIAPISDEFFSEHIMPVRTLLACSSFFQKHHRNFIHCHSISSLSASPLLQYQPSQSVRTMAANNLTYQDILDMDIVAGTAFLAEAIDDTFGNGLGPVARVHPRSDFTLILDVRTLVRLVPIGQREMVTAAMDGTTYFILHLARPGRMGARGELVHWTHPQRLQALFVQVTGQRVANPCDRCSPPEGSRRDPFFPDCRTMADVASGSCAGCLASQGGSLCQHCKSLISLSNWSLSNLYLYSVTVCGY
jgi:hypothetical protein